MIGATRAAMETWWGCHGRSNPDALKERLTGRPCRLLVLPWPRAGCHDMWVSPSKKTRTRKDPEVRLEEITDAAMHLFSERGYWGVSLQDVADACDFTVTGILYHVGNKESLLLEVLKGMDQRLFDGCARELGLDTAGFALGDQICGIGIARLFRALVRVTSEDARAAQLYSVVENESTDPGHPAHDYFIEREKAALASYASSVPAGCGEDPEAVARLAMGLLSGLHVQWLRDPHGVDMVAEWDAIAEMIPVLACSDEVEDGTAAQGEAAERGVTPAQDESAGETSGDDSLPGVRE